jgi:hypothetical protein
MTVEIIGDGCEMISFDGGEGGILSLEFADDVSGYICLAHLAVRVEGNSKLLDLSRLPDGEYSPVLVTEEKQIDLPKIKKAAGCLYPVPYGIAQLATVSMMARRNGERLRDLENRVSELEKSIKGACIF